ncbi:MAG TPA: monothiol bacilliredoxin BrxC family protein [Candidatus Methylomirabilis sp.]|nr:monothiol bacilliredoxin BrxC family protein [Candidatus Methylomirabilis sp.]
MSLDALGEVQEFVRRRPDVPVFLVDVLSQRPLSQRIAASLGIRHESPQAIVLRRGAPGWHASHSDVTADALAKEVAAA